MKVAVAPPPNYADIVAALPFVATKRGIFFCYGDTIFNPDDAHLEPWLIDHERVHSRRQAENPRGWWEKYLASPQFRFDEELPAHRAEYAALDHLTRNQRRVALRGIARRLSGPLYGKLVTHFEAMNLIKAA